MAEAEKGIALCKRKVVSGQAESEGVTTDVAELRAQLAVEQVRLAGILRMTCTILAHAHGSACSACKTYSWLSSV
jgi:hypothetical protein